MPNFIFFSQVDLLRGLLAALGIDHVNMDDLCGFREYCKERFLVSHTHSVIEEKLTENEIGGVILGSLTAGISKRPLNREEYLEEKRSNVTNETERGENTRFSDQIAHSLPEIAMKDLGLKIHICDFDDATSLTVKFGHNQALIHSSEDASDSDSNNVIALRQWLKDHPFILTSLDSKGLEFDDVVVAFEFGRSVWDIASQRVESLRMLRELYVAVTRAKRRVVILVKRKDSAMKKFLSSLDCDIETIKDPDQFQVEFDCETSAEVWQQKGLDLFADGHFGLAASCFAAANEWGLSNWSKAKHLKSLGNRSEAANAYRRAARSFFEELDYRRTLDVLQELSYFPPWEKSDDSLFDTAQSEVPTHFDRHETVRLLLVRNCWNNINIGDLKDPDTSTLFASHKDHPKLNDIVRRCNEEDLCEIGKVLPSIIAQYYFEVQNYPSAVVLYIRNNEVKLAVEATKSAIERAKATDVHIHEIVKVWSQNTRSMRSFQEESYIPLLIQLYSSPLKAAESAGKKCLQTFGRRIIVFALERANIGLMNLYNFHPTEFRAEVNTSLESTLSCCIDIVQWYIGKHDYDNANEYVQQKWKKISNAELLNIISLDRKMRPGSLMSGKS